MAATLENEEDGVIFVCCGEVVLFRQDGKLKQSLYGQIYNVSGRVGMALKVAQLAADSILKEMSEKGESSTLSREDLQRLVFDAVEYTEFFHPDKGE